MRLASVVVGLSACLLTGCTGGGKDGSPTPTVAPTFAKGGTACDLVSASGIRAATKRRVRAASNGPTKAGNVCYVELGNSEQIVLSVFTTDAFDTYDNGGPGAPVGKLGDAAKWLEEQRTLVVRRDGTTFALSLLAFRNQDAEAVRPQAVAIAREVLTRL